MKTVNDLPIEIKEKMMDEQEAQGNKRDWSVFETDEYCSYLQCGFDWRETELGYHNWKKIIVKHNYEPFYEQYTKNMTEICKIEAKLKQLQMRINELKNKEKKFFVPKEVGFFIIVSKFYLIFNNEKSIFYSKNNLFEITTNKETWYNYNKGDNIKLIKTTFGNVNDGDFFLDDINEINKSENYNIKIKNKSFFVNDENEIIFNLFNEEREVFTLKLIK